ncbi:MAG: phosphocholine cytidylyltransferase family protein [Oscillospiraceae bacterium]|nr:phosphocholine cytidylyltransferase family protein [Oscillospiraceae bacterium]
MKAILLAAGVGSRIADDIGQMPKSMLDVGGEPLIVHTVELLQKNHIEVIVITGFKHKVIEEALKDHHVRIYYNPFFRVTNSIGSLWYARQEFINTNEVLIANADVYYTQDLLDKVFGSEKHNFLLSDRTRADVGDYFFLSEDGVLKKYGKELKREERDSEYVGIGVLKKDWVMKFHDRLCEMIENGEYDLWWENVLYSMVDSEDIYTVDVEGIFWSEVDTIGDYRRVLEFAENNRG